MRKSLSRVFGVFLVFLASGVAWVAAPTAPSAAAWSGEGSWRDACSGAIPSPCSKKEVLELTPCSASRSIPH